MHFGCSMNSYLTHSCPTFSTFRESGTHLCSLGKHILNFLKNFLPPLFLFLNFKGNFLVTMSPLSYLVCPKIGLLCCAERLGVWFIIFDLPCTGFFELLTVLFIPLHQMANFFSWTSAVYRGEEINFQTKDFWYSRDILEASNFRSLSQWWTTRTLADFSFMCSREKIEPLDMICLA